MNKGTISRMLFKACKGAGLISKSEIRRATGWGFTLTEEVLSSLEYIQVNRSKYYQVEEVAEAMAEHIKI